MIVRGFEMGTRLPQLLLVLNWVLAPAESEHPILARHETASFVFAAAPRSLVAVLSICVFCVSEQGVLIIIKLQLVFVAFRLTWVLALTCTQVGHA